MYAYMKHGFAVSNPHVILFVYHSAFNNMRTQIRLNSSYTIKNFLKAFAAYATNLKILFVYLTTTNVVISSYNCCGTE